MKPTSLERIYPAETDQDIAESDTIRLHIERYRFAGEHLLSGNIADMACGSGYGTYLLASNFSNKISSITGVDVNDEAIGYARSHYASPVIQYVKEDLYKFQSSALFSTIVSLETIEHLDDPALFISKCKSLLVKGGRLIISAPIVPTMDANPFHLHDFSASSFRKMITREGFVEITQLKQIQQYNPFRLSAGKGGRANQIRKNLWKYYLQKPKKLMMRLLSLLKDGFRIKYLVIVCQKN